MISFGSQRGVKFVCCDLYRVHSFLYKQARIFIAKKKKTSAAGTDNVTFYLAELTFSLSFGLVRFTWQCLCGSVTAGIEGSQNKTRGKNRVFLALSHDPLRKLCVLHAHKIGTFLRQENQSLSIFSSHIF